MKKKLLLIIISSIILLVSGGSLTFYLTHDHVYGEGYVTLKETCGHDGEMSYDCKWCGDVKTEVIEATGLHAYDEGIITTHPVCEFAGLLKYTCNVCEHVKEEEIPMLGHEYSEWYVKEVPTTESVGYLEKKCSHDEEHKITREIPALNKEDYTYEITVPELCESDGTGE